MSNDDAGAQPAKERTGSGIDTETESLLEWIVKRGPRWARIPAITVTILAALSSPVLLIRSQFFGAPKGPEVVGQKAPAANQLDMATSAKAVSDEKTVEDSIANPNIAPEQKQKALVVFNKIRHELQHLSNPKDAVGWTIFAKQSPQDYFGYKVFPSDKCLLIARIENGQGTSEWLTDPNRPIPDLQPGPAQTPTQFVTPRSTAQYPEISEATAAGPEFTLRPIPIALGSTTEPELAQLPSMVDKTPVQGTCLNPHPGPFVGTWGANINQCQQPFYRRWNDGCAHVQVYDHCQNVWGPVVWQYCAAYHHQ